MYLLIPGRHHILTEFQFKYLYSTIHLGLENTIDISGKPINTNEGVSGIVFAVTSANHYGTKRNPLYFYQRAIMVQEFCKDLPTPCFIYGLDDVGTMEDFASYTLKQISHQSDRRLTLTPENTLVVCSTPVIDMYTKLGFRILPAELIDKDKQTFRSALPWELVEKIAVSRDWLRDYAILTEIHSSSFKVWKTYGLGQKVKAIFQDPIIGIDGDITESRDYGSYVRQMDEIAELKYLETSPYIKPGRIGDIGCAVGSWIKQASEDPMLRESDFYGIELARQLFNICIQRKQNGEFGNPNVFFSQKNAVTNLVFEPMSMSTIHTSSLTHEIESYGSRNELQRFIRNRFEELQPGGFWINRDVVGPENGDNLIYMRLNEADHGNLPAKDTQKAVQSLSSELNQLSTYERFLRFAKDFRKKEGDPISYRIEVIDNQNYIALKLRDAAEYLLTKDYTDNWESEMHERFCFWGFSDWISNLQEAGFRIVDGSKAYTNPWILKNRFEGKASLFRMENGHLSALDYPPTNVLLVCQKI